MLKTRALQIAEAAKLKSKAPRVSRRRSDRVVAVAPAHAPSDWQVTFQLCRNRDISTLLQQHKLWSDGVPDLRDASSKPSGWTGTSERFHFFGTPGRTPSVDGRPNIVRNWMTDPFPKWGSLSRSSSDISRTSPTVFRPAAKSAFLIRSGKLTPRVGVSSGSSGVGASSVISSDSRASRSALSRLWFSSNSGADWLSDIFCLDVTG
jgi:hypothetical protein